MQGKSSTQNGQMGRTFFLPDMCQVIISDVRLNRTLSELEHFYV